MKTLTTEYFGHLESHLDLWAGTVYILIIVVEGGSSKI